MADDPLHAKGRGSQINPPNRFGGPYHVPDLEQVEQDEDYLASLHNPQTHYLPDHSRTIITENASPDVGFRFSLNPYRGCSHGCSYCYARQTHEYLGFSAGLDFETKILVKEAAPELFREFLVREQWRPEPIAMSGVTDPYQPAERQFLLARGCLEVAAEARQPMCLITKNALVVRDLDLLRGLAAAGLVHVNLSLATLDADLARTMEPRTSTPAARLRAVQALAQAGVPVRVLMAPLIPGLNDSEIPAVLQAAREVGARAAAYTMLRLPLTVAPVFLEWLKRTQPARAARIEGRIRSVREGKLNDPDFGSRMRGTGELAEQIAQLFRLFAKKHGLDG
ncbi:MAG: PA0069 family radical SAM protein, partial [Planctomycetes bacterium]|nr:PA0069 family radical SAM protein [Planctomycetota bacterium]